MKHITNYIWKIFANVKMKQYCLLCDIFINLYIKYLCLAANSCFIKNKHIK